MSYDMPYMLIAMGGKLELEDQPKRPPERPPERQPDLGECRGEVVGRCFSRGPQVSIVATQSLRVN